jgi:hypothetical protein
MTKKERKEIAGVFYAAAELIETKQENFCCTAIGSSLVGTQLIYKAEEIFRDLFCSDALSLDSHRHMHWFKEWDEHNIDPEVLSRRILGLCLAAHLVEIGEI